MQYVLAASSFFLFFFKLSMEEKAEYDTYFVDTLLSDSSTKKHPIDLNSLFSNLTSVFSCNVSSDDGLHVSCDNVNIRNVSGYLPMETKSLIIRNSYFPVFRESLFSHLGNLELLTLTNNSHRYITQRAFKGLVNLRKLDLSQNDIMVLKSALVPTPKLEIIDLSLNSILNLKTIINAMSHLENLTMINLDHNVKIRRIYFDDFLPLNSSKLQELQLSNTTINVVDKFAFQHLHQLKVLRLSANYLTEESLYNTTCGLADTEIRHLVLRLLVGLQDFPLKALVPLANTTIAKLDMSHNPIKRVPKFPLIPSLTHLNLLSCDILSIEEDAFKHLPNLTSLNFNDNKISFINKNVVPMKQLQILRLENQAVPIDFVGEFSIDNLTFSEASELQMISFESTDLGGTIHRHALFGLINIKVLHLSKTRTIYVEDYAFETLTSLKELHLYGNSLSHLTNYTFYGLKNLTLLNLFYNEIHFVEDTVPLQNMPFLQILLLHRNKIEQIPDNAFSEMHKLQYLHLAENGLRPWRQPILSKQANLTTLHASKNQLTHITSAMMEDFYRVIHYLDATDNPFNCSSCEIEDFRTFMNKSSLTFWYPFSSSENKGTYLCMDPLELRGQSLLQVNLSTVHCSEVLQFENISLLILLCAIIIFVFVCIWISYYFRWYFRYALFHCGAVFKERRSSSDGCKLYSYDAFVSYNSADAPWIVSYLVPELEQTERLRLCIHDRNFLPGRLITDNIMEAIDDSRKIILVLSEHFVKSDWCMYELHMAQHRLFDEKRDVLVLVKLAHIDKKLYTKNLSYLEKTRPCHLWTSDPMGQRLFWDKLRKSLNSSLSTRNIPLNKV